MKKILKGLWEGFWDEFTIRISNTHVIELGGFIIILIIFVIVLLVLNYYNIIL